MGGNRTFQSLRDILPQALNGLGIAERMRRERTFEAWTGTLVNLYPELVVRATAQSLERGTLVVSVTDATAAEEIERNRENILAALQARLAATGIPQIESLRISR